MKKMNRIGFCVIAVVIAMVLFYITEIVIERGRYSVDQYVFEDGSKITVDWNKYEDSEEYKNVRYYYGYLNETGNSGGWYMTAEQWYKLIYEKGGKDYARYCATLTEWRW